MHQKQPVSKWDVIGANVLGIAIGGLPMLIGAWMAGPVGLAIGTGVGIFALILTALFGSWIYAKAEPHLSALCQAMIERLPFKRKQAALASSIQPVVAKKK